MSEVTEAHLRAIHHGSCHCGEVRFSVSVAQPPLLYACNCSICVRSGFLHLIVGRDAFTLTQGAEALTEYRFNTGQAQHLFCRRCGIKPFYVPRSHPDGYSVNARCLDDASWRDWPIKDFDGRNWEAAATALP